MKSLVLKFRAHNRALDVHKIRNFAEDLSLHLKDIGDLPTEEADRAIDTVVVQDIHARQLRRCRVLVEKFLDKHFLASDCDIIEQHGSVRWEGQCSDAAYEFGLHCANLVARNPNNLAAPLDYIISALMTELWDRNFSQSEIRTAFEEAIKDMPRYAAGEERRSTTSTELAIADWRRG